MITPPAEAYIEAVEIYEMGHREYIDALYYSTAENASLKLLTIDREFIAFLADRKYSIEDIITPGKLKQMLS